MISFILSVLCPVISKYFSMNYLHVLTNLSIIPNLLRGDINTCYRRPSFVQSTVAAQLNPQLMHCCRACCQNADQDSKAGTHLDTLAADQIRFQNGYPIGQPIDQIRYQNGYPMGHPIRYPFGYPFGQPFGYLPGSLGAKKVATWEGSQGLRVNWFISWKGG